ncbi:hypothetical protein [Pseudoxanthomonas dokdonensis]|uniref:Uncharacterized protein n=1 Tax=Pseudoxanthomonas dokdonensis TaxID=344882 RepID=A0A0R0CQZ0_9GAMM|nr:hypothetical protein [Pseudoxanthomonas dokdonensis]KRG71941.1 hypothetical protein ABB29_00245 [Pseudoxanthomonas dokdonensis]
MPLPPPLPAAPRSQFVTVLAWLSLAMAVLGIASGLLQALAWLVTPSGPTPMALLQGMAPQIQLPPLLEWSLRHSQALLLASLLSSVITAWVSWRLLQRRDWARRAFIALLLAGAAMAVAGAVAFAGMMAWARQLSGLDPASIDPAIATLQSALSITLYAGVAMICVLHLYLCWKLCTPAIRAEFER